MDIFERLESNVRFYSRTWPAVFCRAKGSLMFSEAGGEYIDFFSGAGALNYGHNNDFIKDRILRYIDSDAITLALDLNTPAKRRFLEAFSGFVLEPRRLNYRIQFCGPTGSNAIEAALKLARKVQRRSGVFAFMGSFHGLSLGSLAATGSRSHRSAAGVPLAHVTFLPFPDGPMSYVDSIRFMEDLLSDPKSGVDTPAAIIVETIQADGGVNVAPAGWLREVRRVCDRHEIMLICDDVQVGCGRTGPFFSFEDAGVVPDMIVLSKSISGYGLPMSMLLIDRRYDSWEPGEHTGTFRSNQLALVAATAALEYRESTDLEREVSAKGAFVKAYMADRMQSLNGSIDVRGAGLIWGVDLAACGVGRAGEVMKLCAERGLVIETVGRNDSVLKILPALTIPMDLLEKGCSILAEAIRDCLKGAGREEGAA